MSDLNKLLPANRQGIAIDVVMIALNIFLFPLFTGRVGKLFDESFKDDSGAFKTLAVLMFLILGGRLIGLYLKRFPLQARLEKSEQTSFPLYFFILNTPVFILTAAFVAVLLFNVLGQTGMVETNYNGMPKDSQVISLTGTFAIIALMCAEVYFLYRLSKPLSEKEKQQRAEGNWKFGLKSEFFADFGLFAYMSIWQVFYNQTAALFLTTPENVPEKLEFKIISVFFLFICFLMFYLAPRAVFLIEDRKHLTTWLFILLVFLSSIVWYL